MEKSFSVKDPALVYRRRIELGYSLSELARRTGLTRQTVTKVEGGIPVVPRTLRLIADALGLSMDKVLPDDIGFPGQNERIEA